MVTSNMSIEDVLGTINSSKEGSADEAKETDGTDTENGIAVPAPVPTPISGDGADKAAESDGRSNHPNDDGPVVTPDIGTIPVVAAVTDNTKPINAASSALSKLSHLRSREHDVLAKLRADDPAIVAQQAEAAAATHTKQKAALNNERINRGELRMPIRRDPGNPEVAVATARSYADRFLAVNRSDRATEADRLQSITALRNLIEFSINNASPGVLDVLLGLYRQEKEGCLTPERALQGVANIPSDQRMRLEQMNAIFYMIVTGHARKAFVDLEVIRSIVRNDGVVNYLANKLSP